MIEAGDYVRTKEQGVILKIHNYDKVLDMYLAVDNDGYKGFVDKKDISKHGKNLIDLIEVGDYVNGHEVSSTDSNGIYDKIIRFEASYLRNITVDEIKTILTHEQYLKNCYKVGVEDE